jgi:hypothetical protein
MTGANEDFQEMWAESLVSPSSRAGDAGIFTERLAVLVGVAEKPK